MATTVIGALSVEITADTQGVKDGLKGAGQALDITGKRLRKGVNQWGKWAIAGATAAAGIAAALVKSNLANINELKNLSDRANTTVEDFQRMAFGASQFGIEQDKLSDILLDFNDRVGDFVTTSAGPMVEFFDQIGPKVGVTIDDFQKLSGPEGLQLYVSSLEKANLNQQEMTFFMERIASDSTNLLPLLKDNGKAMAEQARQAEALGIGLSAIDVAKAAEAERQLNLVSTVLSNELMKATSELAPIITEIAKSFLDVAKESGGFAQFAIDGFRTVGHAVAVLGDGIHAIQVIFKGLEVVARTVIFEISKAFDGIINGSIKEMARAIADFVILPLKQTLQVLSTFSDTAKDALTAIDVTLDGLFGKPKAQLDDFAQAQKEALDESKKGFQELATQDLPTQAFKKWLDEIEANSKVTSENIKKSIANATGGEREEKTFSEAMEADSIREENKSILDALIERGNMRAVKTAEDFAREQAILEDALKNKLITKKEYQNASIALDKEEQDLKDSISGADKILIENESILESLLQRGDMRAETMIGQFEREKQILDEALAAKKVSEEDYAAASIALEEDTARAKNQIAVSGFEAAAQALASGGKKAQKIAKKLAIVGAVIKGKQAAVDAWQAGMSTGGPWAPVVAASYAAASLAQTGSIISSIKSGGSSAGGSVGGGSVSGGGGGGTSSQGATIPQQNGQPASNQQAQPRQQNSVTLNFAGSGVITSEQMRDEFIPLLNDALGDGVELNVTGG